MPRVGWQAVPGRRYSTGLFWPRKVNRTCDIFRNWVICEISKHVETQQHISGKSTENRKFRRDQFGGREGEENFGGSALEGLVPQFMPLTLTFIRESVSLHTSSLHRTLLHSNKNGGPGFPTQEEESTMLRMVLDLTREGTAKVTMRTSQWPVYQSKRARNTRQIGTLLSLALFGGGGWEGVRGRMIQGGLGNASSSYAHGFRDSCSWTELWSTPNRTLRTESQGQAMI